MKGKVNTQRVHKKNIGLDEIDKCITKAVFVTSFARDYFQFAYEKAGNQAAKHVRQQNFIKI